MIANLGNQISAANRTSLASSEDETIYEHLGSCVMTAQKFLSSASAASSNASWVGTFAPQIRRGDRANAAEGSEFGETLSPESQGRIESWVLPPDGRDTESVHTYGNTASPGEEPYANALVEQDALVVPPRKAQNTDLDLDLTRNFLRLGQEKTEMQDHAGAEKFFRKAIQQIDTHNFQDRIALHPAEVQLMLGCACIKQNKLAEAEAVLLPLAQQGIGPDEYLPLTASHFLGDLYLQKGDLQKALDYTMAAVKGRNSLMGSKNATFVESLELLLKVYKEMGDDTLVEAWRAFLPATPSIKEPTAAASAEHQLSQTNDVVRSTTNAEMLRPSLDKPSKGRFALPFRRSSRPDSKTQRSESLDLLDTPIVPSGSPGSSARSSKTLSPSISPVTMFATTPEHGYGDDPFFSDPSLSQSSTLNDVTAKSPSKAPPTPLAFGYNSIKLTQEQAATAAFSKVRDLCARGDHKKAAKEALGFLKVYTGKSDVPFAQEITDNIRRSGKLGLAGTGRGYAPLHFFASLAVERPVEIGLLIEHGVDVNAKDLVTGDPRSSPDTALLLAIERGHSKIVQRLLEVLDIDVEHKGYLGVTPLFLAFERGHTKIVQLLIQHGANPTRKENGQIVTTLLHQAASKYDSETIRHLLARGVAVDSFDNKSRTPMMCALDASAKPTSNSLTPAPPKLIETLTVLVEAGADCHVKDMDGNSAMSRALKGFSWEVTNLLEGKPARPLAAEPLNAAFTWESLAQG